MSKGSLVDALRVIGRCQCDHWGTGARDNEDALSRALNAQSRSPPSLSLALDIHTLAQQNHDSNAVAEIMQQLTDNTIDVWRSNEYKNIYPDII